MEGRIGGGSLGHAGPQDLDDPGPRRAPLGDRHERVDVQQVGLGVQLAAHARRPRALSEAEAVGVQEVAGAGEDREGPETVEGPRQRARPRVLRRQRAYG